MMVAHVSEESLVVLHFFGKSVLSACPLYMLKSTFGFLQLSFQSWFFGFDLVISICDPTYW